MSSLTPRIDKIQNNFLINGNFDFWQRNTTATSTSNDASFYVADRWMARFQGTHAGGGTVLCNRQSATPVNTAVYSCRVTQSVGTASSIIQYHLRQTIEKNISSKFVYGESTISFWYKSNKTGTHGCMLFPAAGAYNGASTFNGSFTVNVADTWEFKVINVPAIAVSNGANAENTAGIILAIGFLAGTFGFTSISTNDYFELSQVCLSEGTLTDPEFTTAGKNIAEELAMCQRYYEKSYDIGVVPGSAAAVAGLCGVIGVSSTVANAIGDQYRVSKRAAATVAIYNPVTGTVNAVYAVLTAISTAVTGTSNGSLNGFGEINSSGTFAGNTHYYYHWTADAEF